MKIILNRADGEIKFTEMSAEDIELLSKYIERRVANLKNSIGHLDSIIKERGWTINGYKLTTKRKELNFWMTILVILKCHPESK
ncbi:MAG: hypothetical protein WC365_06255 [Candidatus Babeliales bacterium]|jgi:hypothetical protein